MSFPYYPPPPPPPPPSVPSTAGHPSGNVYSSGRGGRGARQGGRGGNSHSGVAHQRYPPAQYGSANNTSQWNYQTQQFSAPVSSNEAYPGWSQPGSQQPSFQHYPPSSSTYVSMPASTPQPYAYAGVPIPPPPVPQPGWNTQANTTPPAPLRLGFNERPRSRAQYPPRNHHGAPSHFPGQKRKREHSPSGLAGISAQSASSNRGSLSQRGRQNQERKPKVPAPPPVPSYNFAGLPAKPPPPISTQSDRGNLGKKRGKKRKTNQLGLTPKGDVHEASDQENDEDEEAAFAKLGTPANVAYRGRVYDLSSNTDIEAWIAERKKRFPTQDRIAEKKAAEEKARQQREARKKTVAAQKAESRSIVKADKSDVVKKRGDKSLQDPSRQQELKRKKMEELLRQANKLKAELEGDSHDEVDEEKSKSAKISALKLLDGNMSSDDSDLSGDENSENGEAPDVQSSKGPSRPVKQTQKSASGRMNTNIPCKYYLRDGHCRRKDCRFLHHIPDNVSRKSLYERLSEQEFRSVGLKALLVIKELGDVGYFDEVTSK